ncbi:MAG: CHAT domain-containing protein [Akkermansiaceae bacterium]|nr:CHAT domain-containing protein [Akkermansiaceae bacterium]
MPGNNFARQTNVSRADLNRHIGQLRQALQNPGLDPQPPAQALHKILIAPIAAELAQAAPKTLVLGLTDLLRYIPFGVLHDGSKYLLESYAISLYTPAGGQALQKTNSKDWRIAGLGLTQAVTVASDDNRRFDALPGVGQELASIVRTSASPSGMAFVPSVYSCLCKCPSYVRHLGASALHRDYVILHTLQIPWQARE